MNLFISLLLSSTLILALFTSFYHLSILLLKFTHLHYQKFACYCLHTFLIKNLHVTVLDINKTKWLPFISQSQFFWVSERSLLQLGSVQFSHSVMSNSCDPMNRSTPGFPVHHQLPEPTQTHVHWVGDAIQPFNPVVPFSSCPQSFPASGSFPMSQHFASGGQSIGVSASASVLPMNNQDWCHLGWTGWISLQSKGLSFTSIHDHWKNHSLD